MKELLVIIFVIFIISNIFSPTNSTTEEKTIYFSYCSDFTHNTSNCQKSEYIKARKVIFKTNFEKQIVAGLETLDLKIYKIYFLKRGLSSCRVFDKNNWACKESYMANGEYHDKRHSPKKDDKENRPLYKRISWIKYWFISLKEVLR
jgi:hypothetical protein